MSDRLAKLQVIRQRRREILKQSNNEFIDSVNDKLVELKDTMAEGIEITNIDDLIGRIPSELKVESASLEYALSNFKLPDMPRQVEIKGLEKLLAKLDAPKATAPSDVLISGRASSDNLATKTVIPAQGKNTKIMVTDIIIANSSGMDSEVNIYDGAKLKLTYPAPSKAGAVHSLSRALELSDNTALKFAFTVFGSSIKVSALGYVL